MTKSYTPDELHTFATKLHEIKKNRTVDDPNNWWSFLKNITFWIEIARIVYKYLFKTD